MIQLRVSLVLVSLYYRIRSGMRLIYELCAYDMSSLVTSGCSWWLEDNLVKCE